jgi:hypothetical protein
MKKFWENSPEWQREEAAHAALERAERRRDDAGEALLAVVATYGPARTSREDEARERYLEARQEAAAALSDWNEAWEAFNASPVGQARARALKDPLALAEQEAA